ncbi:MAG: PolC-type DNA polymerase III [Clostridia bacterium]|nr:PolC-type DNA polymerase III [Clostridia bacterium]
MSKTLFDLFKKYNPKPAERPVFEASRDASARIDKERRMVEASVHFDHLIDKATLYAIEESIKECYMLNSVRIFPVYPPSLFSKEYMPQIFMELGRVGIVSRGFFNEYKLDITDGVITVDISFTNGGIELLYDAKTPEILAGIIKSEFGLAYEVEIRRDSGYVFDYAAFERSRRETLVEAMKEEAASRPPMPQPEKAPEEIEKPPLPTVPSLFNKECTFEVLSDTTYKIGHMTFDIEGAELIYGEEEFNINPVAISSVTSAQRGVVMLGQVVAMESKLNRNGDKTILNFGITDNYASITVKCVLPVEEAEPIEKAINKTKIKKKKGTLDIITYTAVLAVKGNVKFDTFDNELTLTPQAIMQIKQIPRRDNAPVKRVELHLHTNMSSMDATIPPDNIVNLASEWGMPAIAITDHGNVQSFPDAMLASDKNGMKVLYGMEAYFVDDTARAVYGECAAALDDEFIVFDIETTGLSTLTCGITEIGAVRIRGGEVTEVFNTFVNPEMPIPANITTLTGITDEMVADAPKTAEAVRSFLDFAGDCLLIAHNAGFDVGFIRKACDDNGIPFSNPYLDTVALSRYVNADLRSHKLDVIAKHYNLGEFNHHRASDDAEMLAAIFFRMAGRLKEEGIHDIPTMMQTMSDKADPLKLRSYHMIILVKNQMGMKNLYKLISKSYLEYYYRVPRIPKSVLNDHREGLIFGSACEAGELFSAVVQGKPRSELLEIAKYYDYLEIQPLCNNYFMLEKEMAKDEEELRSYNRTICSLGEELGIPVCATCDAHFVERHDDLFRKVILAVKKMNDGDRESGLYFRTTEEMLAEFEYLGSEKAYEVVVTNTNLINDMCERVRPIPKGTYTPSMEGAEQELQDRCWNKAREWYGYEGNIPEIVSTRLDRELTSIIKHGFAVLYMIAQKLVAYSESQGYLVGSRGSVGSSVVASFSGISEVNPLPPHYRCPECKHSEFITDGSVGSGFDLPDKNCPLCGTKMIGDGHDIPFETFLGFYGDKSPDIDLNFSGDVQGRVHKYTEELFGSENVFRAGTIGTLASKTAYGYAMKYLEEKQVSVSKAEVQRLVNGCICIKRTTGQHPGGIIVVPREYEIYDFTPVQHPADDPNSDIITTHFQFSYLHDTILKLDELGHDMPTKYKMLERYTDTSVMDVAMNDKKVYELFASTAPLGVTDKDLGVPLGTLGLPEFGTRFIQQVLCDAKPKNFADLMQISGLTHGTDVWLGNAQDLIKEGICDISQVIGTRDGIMLVLIQQYHMESGMAFKIMEDVRKGKGLKPEYEEAMIAHGVPEWYLASCKKIKYMFPKAHAAAYVMSAIRLGWYKIYKPLEFYAGFLTVAPGGFDAGIVLTGRAGVRAKLEELEKKGTGATQKEAEMQATLQLAHEAMARGIKFMKPDLYKSSASAFLPENGRIRMPFNSLSGLGDTAAQKIVAARDEGELLSRQELQDKAQLSKSVMDILQTNGVLDDLSETNQISFF